MNSQRRNLDPRQMVTLTSTSSSATSTSTPTDSTSHLVSIDVTPPIMCQTMNITFDPTLGQPPFDVLIAFENWFVERLSREYSYTSTCSFRVLNQVRSVKRRKLRDGIDRKRNGEKRSRDYQSLSCSLLNFCLGFRLIENSLA